MFQSPTMFNYHGGDQEFLVSTLAAITDNKNIRRIITYIDHCNSLHDKYLPYAYIKKE